MIQPEMRSLQLLLFIWLLGVCGDSVHPEERNNRSHDPLNPNMLQCPNTPIEGKPGGRVILPCSTKDKMDISYDQVDWTFKDPTTWEDKSVHLYFHGEDYLQKQSDDFKDRTSLFREQLSSGNCSLSLLVTTSHSGTYHSRVPGHLPCTVTLKVLQVQNTTIERQVGERVILPCSVGNNTNITRERIEWFKGEKTSENNQPIHKCIWRPNATQIQREEFKNITRLFVEELPSGNVSLSLRLKASYNDTYYCYVGGRLYCIVTIIDLPAGGDDSSQKQDNNGTDGQTETLKVVLGVGITAALLPLVIIIIIIVAYRYREQLMNYHSGMKPKNGQVYHGVPVQAQQPPQDEEKKPLDQNPTEEQFPMNVFVDQGH